MSSTVEQPFATPTAPELLHVPWHMQKLSFACHSCTRSAVVCLQVAGTFRIHTCGGFDPPPPRTRSTGAPPQCRCVAHTPGLAGASTGQDGRLLRRTEMGEGEPHIFAAIFGSFLWLLPQCGDAPPCCSCCAWLVIPYAWHIHINMPYKSMLHAMSCAYVTVLLSLVGAIWMDYGA